MPELFRNKRLLKFARGMRHEPATAEKLLWAELRNRKLVGIKFRRQELVEGYIADFLSHDLKLIIELDGNTHGNREGYDKFRDQKLIMLGFTVLRFSNVEIYTSLSGVLQTILLHNSNPHPIPLPEGEGANRASK